MFCAEYPLSIRFAEYSLSIRFAEYSLSISFAEYSLSIRFAEYSLSIRFAEYSLVYFALVQPVQEPAGLDHVRVLAIRMSYEGEYLQRGTDPLVRSSRSTSALDTADTCALDTADTHVCSRSTGGVHWMHGSGVSRF